MQQSIILTKKSSIKPLKAINPDRFSKKQNKLMNDDLSIKRLIEKKLKKYKKLYADGMISKESYSIKRKKLLEKLLKINNVFNVIATSMIHGQNLCVRSLVPPIQHGISWETVRRALVLAHRDHQTRSGGLILLDFDAG